MKETELEREREKERRPQAPFGPSVDSLCHRDSQQPISPIGFLFLTLPPPPCAVLLVMNILMVISYYWLLMVINGS